MKAVSTADLTSPDMSVLHYDSYQTAMRLTQMTNAANAALSYGSTPQDAKGICMRTNALDARQEPLIITGRDVNFANQKNGSYLMTEKILNAKNVTRKDYSMGRMISHTIIDARNINH